jgi:hypothetical protein
LIQGRVYQCLPDFDLVTIYSWFGLIYTPLGNTVGWMGTEWWSDNSAYETRRWFSVGYPVNSLTGQVPIVEAGVYVNDVDDDEGGKKLESNTLFATGG